MTVVVVEKTRGVRRDPAILAFLAVDDAFGVHERVTANVAVALGLSTRGDVLFLVPYLPLLATVFAVLWTTARLKSDLAGRIIRLALTLLAAAVVLRVARAAASASALTFTEWQRTLGDALMHDTELVAWVAVAAGLVLAQTARMSARTPRSGRDRPISST